MANPADLNPRDTDERTAVRVQYPGLDATELAGALHDVSNALTVVVGWLEVALGRATPTDGDAGDSANVVDAIDVALSHARFGHRVARRAIGGTQEPDTASLSLPEILKTSLLAVEPLAARRQVSVHMDGFDKPHISLVSCDAATQILVNLLLNAIAFSPERSRVVVACRSSRHSVTITVADEGPGIEPSRADTILVASRSTRSGGTGIGLTHSASLARDHGGHLRLVRSSPSAVFELRWQRANAGWDGTSDGIPPDEISRPYSSRPINVLELAGLNVLLLEDDEAICSLVELAFFSRGCVVRSASTLVEAQRLAQGQSFDVVLVDLSPIVANVPQALASIRGRATTPFVLITGSASGMPEGTEQLFSSWVRKPFEAGELIEAVRRVSGRG